MIPGSANALLLATAAGAGGAYEVSRSVRFNSVDSAHLSRLPGTAGNRTAWSWSAWIKRTDRFDSANILFGYLDATGNTGQFVRFLSDSTLDFSQIESGSYTARLITTQVFRDPGAWFHLLVVWDSANGTANSRHRIYINGTEVTTFTTRTNPSSSLNSQINTAVEHAIGTYGVYKVVYTSAYYADVHFIDGQALDPTSFGEVDTNGVWQPIAYSGSYGTNGFHLPFSDNSTAAALGYDAAGSNDWTVNNLSVAAGSGNDSLRDSPTNGSQTDTGVGGEVVGNYCTWNPLDCSSGSTFANGNLEVANNANTRATISVPLGAKIYFECQFTSSISKIVGFAKPNTAVPSYPGAVGDSYGYQGDGYFYASTGTVSTTSSAINDVIMVAIDRNSHKIWFGKNGTWFGSGDPATGANAAFSSIYSSGDLAPTCGWTGNLTANFGQRPFAYTAPSGFKALCTTNLPEPTIADGSTVMDVALYTGNGTTQTISGLNFSPDLVWIKNRSTNAISHRVFDAVRGVYQELYTDLTNAEVDRTGIDAGVKSFDSDGFTLGSFNYNGTNQSGETYVAWTWDAGTSNATNTSGSITSTVRANISAGFSVITFTAPSSNQNFTVGHGLGIAPAFTILKRRDSSTGGDWWTWHIGLGDNTTDYLALNQTSAENSLTAMWGATGRTSSLLGFSTPNSIVASGTYVVYAFAPVAGYSAFGSYTGNGSSTDGPFVYTGFKPRFILIKGSSVANTDWAIIDTARDTYNIATDYLAANSSGAEQTLNLLDVVSNGFKIKAYTDSTNQNGQTFVWAAFASHPFATSRAR